MVLWLSCTEVCVYNLSLFSMINVTNTGFGGGGWWSFLSMNSAYSANWKYQESQRTQICLVDSGAEALCFCLTIRQRKSQILTWCMLTQALKSVNLSSDLWFMQCNPVITVGKHRWSSLLWPLEVSKLIKEWNDKAGS